MNEKLHGAEHAVPGEAELQDDAMAEWRLLRLEVEVGWGNLAKQACTAARKAIARLGGIKRRCAKFQSRARELRPGLLD